MSSFRGTILFAVVVVLVGGTAYWQLQKQSKETAEKPSADLLFSDLKTSDIVEVQVTSGVQKYKLKSENEHWSVIEPLFDRCDDHEVEMLLQKVTETHATELDVGGATIEWQKYGLAEPEMTVNLKTKTGTEKILKIGKVKTYDNGYYLRRADENKLLTAAASLEGLVTVKLALLRNKKIDLTEGLPLKITMKSTLKR